MAWRVKVRKDNLNGDEIMLQRDSMPFLLKVFVIPQPYLWWLFCFSYWRDWKLLNNTLYEVEQKMAKKSKELQGLQEERKILQATLKAEKKEISDSKRCRSGLSEPYPMEVGFLDWLFCRKYPDLDPPDGKWMKIFDRSFLNDKPKGKGIRERMGVSEHPNSSGVTVYSTEKPESLALGDHFDHVVQYKEEEKKKRRGNNGNSRKHWKNRRKGESDEEYEERMEIGPEDWVEDY